MAASEMLKEWKVAITLVSKNTNLQKKDKTIEQEQK